MYISRQNKGFTLVEMSIVLTIIALLVGGTLAGEEIVEGSKRNAVIADIQGYKTAFEQFKEKYYSPPGDMLDAQSVWGASATSNGDGDGIIERNASNEDYLAWQHLGLANLIEGRFPGAKTTSGTNLVLIGNDIPKGPYSNSGYRMIYNQECRKYASSTTNCINANSIMIGKGNTDHLVNAGIFSAAQASSVDQKIDDNKPSMGQFVTFVGSSGSATDCVVADPEDMDETYALTVKTKNCISTYFLETVNN